MIVFIDIDGTLANITERNEKAGSNPGREDREVYQAWLDTLQNPGDMLEDAPVDGMAPLLQTLAETYHLVYLTGRSNAYRTVTEAWLALHRFPRAEVVMRGQKDWRKAAAFKEQAMLAKLEDFGWSETSERPVLVLDDDGDGCCAEMYKKHGWTHLKAMSGGTY